MISEYKSTGLYNILSDTYTPADTASDAASADYSTVIDTLNKNHNKFGRFSLSPVNNPEFKVVGREGLSKDGTDFTKLSAERRHFYGYQRYGLHSDAIA